VPENAVELVDTCLDERSRLCETLELDDINRARRSIVSSLVMQGESTRARAGRLAYELMEFETCGTLASRVDAVQSADPEDVRQQAEAWCTQQPTIVALGPEGCLPYQPWTPPWVS